MDLVPTPRGRPRAPPLVRVARVLFDRCTRGLLDDLRLVVVSPSTCSTLVLESCALWRALGRLDY